MDDGTPGPQDGADDAWAQRVSLGVSRGDGGALTEFYTVWFARSMAAARHAGGRRDEAFCLDIVQDAMVKAASKLRPVGSVAELTVWMDIVVRSCALDRLRAESARRRHERAATPPEQEVDSSDLAGQIAWLELQLASASAADRQLLRHRIVEGATLEQAGLAVGITGAAAHGRLRRLLQLLRKAGGGGTGGGHER